MNPIYRIIEILILIVLPILVLFLRSTWSKKEIYLNVSILPLIWYLFYAPIHELGHVLGCFIVGVEISDFQLFSHFWEGSYGFTFVNIKGGYSENMSSFIILISPYLLDQISIILGFYF
ncbi:MAG: hypothetical protein H6613_03480 [Ignavibacteriales bacterium]|nr:hypothetical protein [Ignavibacteriales bacterium]